MVAGHLDEASGFLKLVSDPSYLAKVVISERTHARIELGGEESNEN